MLRRLYRTPIVAGILAGLLILGGCESITPIEGLTLVDQAVESSARQATTLLQSEQIKVRDACKIEVYGRFAHEAVKEGRLQWFTGNPEGAADHLQAARAALAGLTPDILAVIEEEC